MANNILILDFDDIKNPYLNAGQARATLEVGSRLVSLGNKVTVLSSKYPGYKDRKEQGISYVHIGLGTKYIRLNNLIYIAIAPLVLQRHKVDCIIECFTAPFSTMFTPLFTNTPVVAIPTCFEADLLSKKYHLPFEAIEKFGLKLYRYFLPYTEYFDQKMKAANPQIVSEIIPEGVSDEYLKLKQKDPKHILFLGRYDVYQKGIDLMLEAYSKVKSEIKYPLVIVGKGTDTERIKSLITKYELSDSVKFLGAQYGDAKMKLLSHSVAVAFPSRHEGFSLFSLEATASGCPLISFDIPALKWLPASAGLKAKCFDVDEYAKQLLMVNDSKKMRSMRKAARETAAHYTWDSVAMRISSFIDHVVLQKSK